MLAFGQLTGLYARGEFDYSSVPQRAYSLHPKLFIVCFTRGKNAPGECYNTFVLIYLVPLKFIVVHCIFTSESILGQSHLTSRLIVCSLRGDIIKCLGHFRDHFRGTPQIQYSLS